MRAAARDVLSEVAGARGRRDIARTSLTRCDERGSKAVHEPSSPVTGRARSSSSIAPRNSMAWWLSYRPQEKGTGPQQERLSS